MTKQEIVELFNYRHLNLKTNNYIFCESSDFTVIDRIPNRCGISIPESNIDIDYAYNIKLDLKEINVRDILSYTLQFLKDSYLLDVSLDYTLDFNNKFDLFKFQNVLRNYSIVVQLIFYNVEELDAEDQMLFNEIYYFNSLYFNVNSIIKCSNFQFYFLTNNRVLDDRENYTKIKLVKERSDSMKNVDIKIDKFVDLLNRYAVYGESGYYISPLVMTSIIPEEIKMSMSTNEIIDYIKNVKVLLTDEEIKEYLQEKFNQDNLELKVRQENRSRLSKNPLEWTDEDIKKASQQFVDDLSSAKYKYEPYTLEYFKTYINILKEKSLALFDIIKEIQNIALGKIRDENKIKQIIDSLSEYDIKILENGNIYYQDLIRLLTPLVENVLALKEMAETANNLETYLNFTVSRHSLYRDGFTESDIYPKRALQIKAYEFDTKGYIRLSSKQKEKLQKESLDNFSAWLDIVDSATKDKIEATEQQPKILIKEKEEN